MACTVKVFRGTTEYFDENVFHPHSPKHEVESIVIRSVCLSVYPCTNLKKTIHKLLAVFSHKVGSM